MWRLEEWSGGGGGPCARGKHAAALLDGWLYVLAGRGAGGALPLRDCWRYCLAIGVWERVEMKGDPPPALQEHSATAHEGRLYVFGGEAGAHSTETPLWLYDTETQLWRKLPGHCGSTGGRRRSARAAGATAGAGPRGRRGHSAHALRDCLLVYGGYKDLRGSTNELWAFHYETSTWHQVRTATAGPARHRHAAALRGTRLYVHGGRCDLRECGDLWLYDTLSRAWSLVRATRAPRARSGHAALAAGAHLYVFGGDCAGVLTNELWRFHFALETWEQIEQGVKWPSPRVDACALLLGDSDDDWPERAGSEEPEERKERRERGLAPPPERAGSGRGNGQLLARLAPRRRDAYTYTALAERDSAESLAPLPKSRSAHAVALPAGVTRDPTSVPDFAARLSRLQDDIAREARSYTRFEPDASSTSEYASAERVHSSAGGFSNPHYLGPDVRALAALTPDSGVGEGDVELRDLRPQLARLPVRPRRVMLLLGGREPPHHARLQSPLSVWTYSLP